MAKTLGGLAEIVSLDEARARRAAREAEHASFLASDFDGTFGTAVSGAEAGMEVEVTLKSANVTFDPPPGGVCA